MSNTMSQLINNYAADNMAARLGLQYHKIIYQDRMIHVAWTLFCLVAGFKLLIDAPYLSYQMGAAIVLLLFFVRSVMGPVHVKELTPDSLQKLQIFFDDADANDQNQESSERIKGN